MDRQDSKESLTFFYAFLIVLTVFGATLFFERIMWAEDAVVLFNRFFNFQDPSPFFYYAGYVSLYPQAIGFLARTLAPEIQIIIYGLAAFSLCALKYVYIYRITRSAWPCFLISLYFFVADSNYFANLTYSLWNALAIIALAFVHHSIARTRLRTSEVLLIFVLASGSPLSIAMVPCAILYFYMTRDRRGIVLIGALIACFAFLTNWKASSEPTFALEKIDLLVEIILIDTTSVTLSQLFDFVRLIAFVLCPAALLYFRSDRTRVLGYLALYISFGGILLAFFISRFEGDIGGRYLFLQMVLLFLLFWEVASRLSAGRTVFYGVTLASMAVLVPIQLIDFRENIAHGVKVFSEVATWDGETLVAFPTRTSQDSRKWALVLSPEKVDMRKCGETSESVFRAYCSDGVYYHFDIDR